MPGAVRLNGRYFQRPTQRDIVAHFLSLKGDRPIREVARAIGLTEGMIRQMVRGDSDIGADTLGVLLLWDSSFEDYVLEDLRARGELVRTSRELTKIEEAR